MSSQGNVIDPGMGYVNGTWVLRLRGIPLRDRGALIAALKRRDVTSGAAAYALGWLPKDAVTVAELNRAVFADDEHLMLSAIGSLEQFGNRQWVSAAKLRLRRIKDQHMRLALAEHLAQACVFDGWDLVEKAIMSDKPPTQRVYFQWTTTIYAFQNMDGIIVRLEHMKSVSTSENFKAGMAKTIEALAALPSGRNPCTPPGQ
ncbi:MAG TPA: hypothetical protein VGH38_00375 [Bryobacteraceae bacterium]